MLQIIIKHCLCVTALSTLLVVGGCASEGIGPVLQGADKPAQPTLADGSRLELWAAHSRLGDNPLSQVTSQFLVRGTYNPDGSAASVDVIPLGTATGRTLGGNMADWAVEGATAGLPPLLAAKITGNALRKGLKEIDSSVKSK